MLRARIECAGWVEQEPTRLAVQIVLELELLRAEFDGDVLLAPGLGDVPDNRYGLTYARLKLLQRRVVALEIDRGRRETDLARGNCGQFFRRPEYLDLAFAGRILQMAPEDEFPIALRTRCRWRRSGLDRELLRGEYRAPDVDGIPKSDLRGVSATRVSSTFIQ